MKNILKNKVFLIATTLALIIAITFLLIDLKTNKSVKYQFVSITKGNIESTISSTGTLNPVTEITVGTQVSGTIEKVFVDFNDRVSKGQIIAVLDSAVFRMSVGACSKDILVQFLTEAAVLSISAGIVGILFATAVTVGLNSFTSLRASMSIDIILIAFLFSGAIGVFFGYYPAKKAAAMNPIDALRYE